MPKVMHINCASTGSTGKIISDIADYAVTKGFESLLCAPCAPGNNKNIQYFRTSLPYEQGMYRRLNYLYGYQYGFAPLSTVRIKNVINKEKPDILHIHCINGFMVNVYELFRFIKKQGIPTIITNHAEFFYTGNCAYTYDCDRWMTGCGQCPQGAAATFCKVYDTSAAAWKRMQEAFGDLNDAVMVSVSPWVEEKARTSPITAELTHTTILNGVNTDIFTYRNPLQLRKKHGFSEEQTIVFHPTANFSNSETDRKGGRYILELARNCPDITFLVAGRHSQGMDVSPNMILLGMVTDQQMLAEYYSLADITVVAGKRETFNMPVAESLCCGTPIVGFLAGGPESVAIEAFSRFSEYGDVEKLEENMREMLQQAIPKEEVAKLAKEKYAAAHMGQKYTEIYKQLLTKGRH